MTTALLLAALLSVDGGTPRCEIHRDKHGRIERSAHARAEFRRLHPCPSPKARKAACPGYVIDHICPLACGGADAPENMQWQSKADAAAKDKWERQSCEKLCTPENSCGNSDGGVNDMKEDTE